MEQGIQGRISVIDGWRAVAVISVILGHLSDANRLYSLQGHPLIVAITLDALVGVNLFFIISGYLITRVLLRESSQGAWQRIKSFYCLRALRILPPVYVLIVFVWSAFLLGLTEPLRNPQTFVGGLFFFLNYVPGPPPDAILGHLWTLNVEEHFYIFWPLLFFALPRKWLGPALTAFILSSLILRYQAYGSLSAGAWDNWYLSTRTHYNFPGLAIGSLLAIYQAHPQFVRWLNWARRYHLVFWSAFALVTILPYLHFTFGFEFVWKWKTPFAQLLLALLFAHSVFERGDRAPNPILNSRVLGMVGRASYSIYLWQQVPIYMTFKNDPTIVGFLKTTLSIAVLSSLSYLLIEKSFESWRSQIKGK